MTAVSVPPSDQAARDRIRHELDATLFVEAGAGTGKTRELVERILQLVLTGRTELRRIAAITFTEAAAAELRDRVRIRLEEATQDEAAHSEEERERCRVALAEVDAAAIETLHGFAQRILASHPLEAGLPPLFQIEDEIRASIAFEERWNAFFDELLEDPAREEALLRAFTLRLDPKELREVARAFHRNWDRLDSARIEERPLLPVEATEFIAALSGACELSGYCQERSDALFQHLARLEVYRDRLAAADSDARRLRVLVEPTRIQAKRIGRRENWEGVTPDQIRDQLKQAEALRDELLERARADVLPTLLAALRGFVLRYANERRREGRLEFHDLLVQTRNLLRGNAGVRRALRAQYSHILIDEFQDTDPLQIEIAVWLAADTEVKQVDHWRETAVQGGRLFFVGDPKQSVYRFRRADIDLYQEVQQRFDQQTARLTQNFRSVPAVIEWVNHCLGGLMGDEAAEGQVAYLPLQASRDALDEGSELVHVLGGPAEENLGPIREREAKEIARVIQLAKAEGWPVAERGEDSPRGARYADIALLMPTRTTLPLIEQALEEAGIPYRIESRSLVYDTQEVRELLAILRAIDDPTDQVALIAALRSPAFACSDDDLLRFAQAGGRWDYRRDAPGSLQAGDRVVDALRALHVLHQRRWWETISGIVEAVIRERRLFELAFAQRRPRERWQRLRFVLDQARGFAEGGGTTLRQFIDWAERQADEQTRVVETLVPEPDDDAVRIMTIHAAKGLEFPITLLAGLNVASATRARGGATVLWAQDGEPEVQIGSRKTGFRTSGFEELEVREVELDQQEKIRLLYVAATRARDHLIVSLHHKAGAESLAARLHARCMEAPTLWRLLVPASAQTAAAEERSATVFEDGPERRQAWLEEREEQLKAMRRAARVSATDIATSAAGATDDPNLQKDPPVEETPPWRRGRAGTSVGRAVHAVLQSIDLATGADVEGAARAQAAAEGIAGRIGDVARMVRAALDAPSVREAVAGERYWRELYVAAPVDGVTVEGFVDLLYETPDGLVVVDYKTDVVPGERELEAAVTRYRLQGAAYALALEEAIDRAVVRCVFVFVQPSAVREREISDLPTAKEQVRAELRRRGP